MKRLWFGAGALMLALAVMPVRVEAQATEGYEALEALIGDTYRNFTEPGRDGEDIPSGVFESVATTPVDNFNRQESWAWEGQITGRMLFVGMWPAATASDGAGPATQLFGMGNGGLFDCSSTGPGRWILCPPGDDGSQFAGGAKFFGLQFAGDVVAGSANNEGEFGLRFDRRNVTNYQGDPQFYDLFDGADCFIVTRFNMTRPGGQFMPPVRIDFTGDQSPQATNPFPEFPTDVRVHLGNNLIVFALPLDEPCINASGAGAFSFVAANGFRRPGSVTSYVTPDLPELFALDDVIAWELGFPETATVDGEGEEAGGEPAVVATTSDAGGQGRNGIWLLPAAAGVLVAGYGLSRVVRSREEETDPTALTVEDLQQYEDLGIDTDFETARRNQALADEKESDFHRAEQHEIQLERDRQAEVAEVQSQAAPPPPKPIPGAAYVTDSVAAEFVYSFVNELAYDFSSGRARTRLYWWGANVDDGFKEGASNLVTQIETAWEGWGNIINNPSSLGQLDEGVEFAVEQLESKANELNAAALAGDDKRFGEMMGNATGQAGFQAVLTKGMQAGQAALVERLGAGAVATEGATATATGVRPPATAPASVPRPPAPPPTPTPAAPPKLPSAPRAYGGGARTTTPVRGGGTPAQAHPNGCGAAVARGLLRDLGITVPFEGAILAMGRKLGEWAGTGLTHHGLFKILNHYLPKNFRMFGTNLMSLPNKAFNIGKWMKLNPKGEVIVGIRWRGAGTHEIGHWVRVEAVRNGYVILGDPQFSFVSVAVPEAMFNFMAEVAIVVVP